MENTQANITRFQKIIDHNVNSSDGMTNFTHLTVKGINFRYWVPDSLYDQVSYILISKIGLGLNTEEGQHTANQNGGTLSEKMCVVLF